MSILGQYIPLPVIFIAIFFAASAFFFMFSLVPSKSIVSKKLEELEGLKYDNKQMSRSQAIERLFSEQQVSKMRQQMIEAGWYRMTPGQFIIRMLAGGGFGLALGLSLATYFNRWDTIYIGLIAMLTGCGFYLPMSQLRSAIKARKIEIQKGLPDLLDMLATTVRAGLAFNGALTYTVDIARGALREEIQAVLSEIRLGRSRSDSLRAMAERVRLTDLSTTVTAIVQAERLGSNLASVLGELSDEARNKRMNRAEEIAAMMPIKMVIPMALFMLPALFVMIFGGVVAQYYARAPK
jgi:tight adherence protein C